MADEERYTLFDRIAVAFGAALIALVSGSLLWTIVKLRSCRAGSGDVCSFAVPFDPVFYFVGLAAAVGFFLGPERTASFFSSIWGKRKHP
jgi:hypothetical protein